VFNSYQPQKGKSSSKTTRHLSYAASALREMLRMPQIESKQLVRQINVAERRKRLCTLHYFNVSRRRTPFFRQWHYDTMLRRYAKLLETLTQKKWKVKAYKILPSGRVRLKDSPTSLSRDCIQHIRHLVNSG